MQFILNNRPETIEDREQLTVRQLLDHKNYTFKFLAVRVNNEPVKTDEYENKVIRDGDKVIVHHLISGG